MRRFFCISLMSLMLLALPMKAQYPSVPADVQAAVDKMMEKCWASSDSAFAVALPIIEAEAAAQVKVIEAQAEAEAMPEDAVVDAE